MEKLADSKKRVCPMDEHERFVKFYDLIPEIFRSYTANFGWTIGLLSAANGWILSSDKSREFIHKSPLAFFGLLLAIFLIGFIHSGACWAFYQRSQQKIAQLSANYEDLDPLPFREYEITQSIFLFNLLMSWSLLGALLTMIIAAHQA